MTRTEQIVLGAGLAVGVGVPIALVIVWPVKTPQTPPTAPPPHQASPQPQEPTVERWVEYKETDPNPNWIWLSPGWRYRAIVKLPWYVPTPSEGRAKEYAEGKGWRDVVVTRSRPSWATDDGDLYVEASWGGSEQWYERPGALKHAWVRL